MRVTDEQVAIAMAAFEAYFQDPAHESQCDECNGEGCTPVGVDSDRDWCPKCGGPGTLNAATEEGGIRAALEAALSHAAGQDGEQCRAASVEPRRLDVYVGSDGWKARPLEERLRIHAEDCERCADERTDAVLSAFQIRAMHDDLHEAIRALSRGVPEGMDRLRPRNWTREMDVAWHTNIPDTVKAFDALIAAAIAAQQPILGVTGGTDEGWGS